MEILVPDIKNIIFNLYIILRWKDRYIGRYVILDCEYTSYRDSRSKTHISFPKESNHNIGAWKSFGLYTHKYLNRKWLWEYNDDPKNPKMPMTDCILEKCSECNHIDKNRAGFRGRCNQCLSNLKVPSYYEYIHLNYEADKVLDPCCSICTVECYDHDHNIDFSIYDPYISDVCLPCYINDDYNVDICRICNNTMKSMFYGDKICDNCIFQAENENEPYYRLVCGKCDRKYLANFTNPKRYCNRCLMK